MALLFVAGVVCFPAVQRPALLTAQLGPVLLFGLLCFANCTLISFWENEVDRVHGQSSLALQSPRGRPLIGALPWMIATAGSLCARTGLGGSPSLARCAAVSGGLLGVIDLSHRRLGRQLARATADLALLTPLVLLWPG